jgi:hypothetical protein
MDLALSSGTTAPSSGGSLSTGAVVALGVVGLAAIGGVWWLAAHHHPNPTFGPNGDANRLRARSTKPRQTKKRLVAFRARLDVSPAYEVIVIFPNETAILYRYRYPVVRFRPAPHQLRKIRYGEGEVLIYADQIIESLVGR